MTDANTPDPSQGGEVSTTSNLDPDSDDTPISPGDATEGYPVSESGYPDEPKEAGPDADPHAGEDTH